MRKTKIYLALMLAAATLSACSTSTAGGDPETTEENITIKFETDTEESEDAAETTEATETDVESASEESAATETTDAETTAEPTTAETTTEEPTTEETTTVNPDIGLTALAVVPNYVNVRSEPNTEAEIVGKIYNYCAATIMDEVEEADGTWYLMTSGNCTGYIKAEFFLIGDEAEAMREQVGVKKGVVVDDYLRVRATPSMENNDNVVTYYRTGTEVAILSISEDGWAEIQTDETSTGYVYASCLNIFTEFKTAVTIQEEEEELARKAAIEEAARQAQLAYEAALAAQAEAERLAAEAASLAAAEEAARIAAEQQAKIDAVNSLRAAVVAYALQFEGCPYVHGGRSLSNGTDCSGFTSLVYRTFGYTLEWTPAGQSNQGTRVDLSALQPGDLLFYSNNVKYLGHVAMYIGNGKIIHAASETYGICIWDWNYRQPLFAVRIIN